MISNHSNRLRLAIFVRHPIQHFAPVFSALAANRSLDMEVFYYCRWGAEQYVDPEFGREIHWDVPLLDGYRYRFLALRHEPTGLGFFELNNQAVSSALQEFRPHVLLVFGYAHATSWKAAMWARQSGTPVLLYSDSRLGPRRLGSSNPFGARGKDVLAAMRRVLFYTLVDGAVAVGEQNRLFHLAHGIPTERIYRGTYPFDAVGLRSGLLQTNLARAQLRKRYGLSEDDFVVIFCGKLVERKRPLDLAEALTQVRGRTNRRVVGLFVGDGPERPRLRNFAAMANVPIVDTGFVNASDLGAHFSASDALVLPSEIESFGLVVTEAAAFGLPVIVSDRVGCVGARDVARPGINALVFRCGDVNSLALAIERLEGDLAERTSMARASRGIAKEHDARAAAAFFADAAWAITTAGPRRLRSRATSVAGLHALASMAPSRLG